MGWHHWKWKTFSMAKDAVWNEASKEHPGIPHMSLVRGWTSYQGRRTQVRFPSLHSTPIMRRPCSEGDSRVRGTLRAGFWKPAVGRASTEELLSQLPEDVIGSGLNKEYPGRAPYLSPTLLHCIYGGGHRAPAARSPWSKGVSSLKQWRFMLWSSGSGHCVAWQVGISLEAAGS
jgi:hypothetical protein